MDPNADRNGSSGPEFPPPGDVPAEASGVLSRRGCDLHHRVAGGGNGPTVVLCHGAYLDHRTFDLQVGPLVAAGYRVLRFDLRGHGASKPMGGVADVDTLTADLLALLDATVGEPVVLLGHAYGGFAVQELYHRYPETVRAMVLVSSLCTTRPEPLGERLRMRAVHAGAAALPASARARAIAARMTGDSAVREYVEQSASALDGAEFRAALTGVRRSFRADPSHRVDVPLLLLRGGRDRVDPGAAAVAAEWARREPDCRYEVIQAAGHIPHQDEPRLFNEVLLDFLRTRVPPDGGVRTA